VHTDPTPCPSRHNHRHPSTRLALAATRTVLDGGVGKMIDLARSNLRSIRAVAATP